MNEFDPRGKLLYQVDRLNAFMEGDWSMPPALVEISPTNMCPAKCSWCFFAGGHTQDHLPWEDLKAFLEDIAEAGVQAISWTGGGDPSVYPHINKAIDLAHELNIQQGMFTNGYKEIDHPEKLEWIRLTVTDRMTVPTSASFYAQSTKTGVVVNLDESVEPHLTGITLQASRAGCHYLQIRPALARSWKDQKPVSVPTTLKVLETDTFRVLFTVYKWADYQKPHGYPICHAHRLVPFLWHDGSLDVCSYHHGRPEFSFGNIITDGGYKGVWLGERRRQMLADGVGVIPECQNCCKNHEANKVMAAMIGDDPKPADWRFI